MDFDEAVDRAAAGLMAHRPLHEIEAELDGVGDVDAAIRVACDRISREARLVASRDYVAVGMRRIVEAALQIGELKLALDGLDRIAKLHGGYRSQSEDPDFEARWNALTEEQRAELEAKAATMTPGELEAEASRIERQAAPEPPEELTTKEAAEYAGVTANTIRGWAKAEKIVAWRSEKRSLVIDRGSLEAHLISRERE